LSSVRSPYTLSTKAKGNWSGPRWRLGSDRLGIA
jgi:hypothetical protein